MKKLLSVAITAVMLLTMVTSVSALTVNEVIGAFNNPLNLELALDVESRPRGTHDDDYADTTSVTLARTSGATVGVDYKTTLDMQKVRGVFDKDIINRITSGDQALKDEYNAGVVSTLITVNITIPSGAAYGNLQTAGTLSAGGIFEEVSRVVSGNNVTITYKNTDGLKVGGTNSLTSAVNNNLKDVVFELENCISYNAAGDYDVTVQFSGSTTVTFTSMPGGYVINYTPLTKTNRTTVALEAPSAPAGGGGGVSSYIVKFNTNGGTEVKNAIVGMGEKVKAPVTTKEGYVLKGWYTDAELTQAFDFNKSIKSDITLYAAWVEDDGSAGATHEIPEMLNGEDHFAYIAGYPDGTVRPNANISRAEVTSIFFRLLIDEAREQNLTSENNFSDVNEGEWYNTAISTMAKLGIINGRDDETFAPNAPITRAEFAVICARFDNSEYEITDNFTDVAGHWAEAEIHEAAAYGWIKGYEDNTFKPDQLITRAEAMTMINRIVKRVPETVHDMLDSMTKWPDNSDESAWYYIAVQEATNGHAHEMKNNIHEAWTESSNNRDWTDYEK